MTADEYIAQRKAMRAQGLLPTRNIEFTNAYSDLLKPQALQESQGWLADLLGGVVNPFVNLVKMGGEGLAKGISAIGGQDMSQYKPVFMKPSEYYGVQERPLQTAAGATATLGSLLVPGGVGVKGMALQGLKAGGLFGGGQQLMSEKNDIASVLGSTITGGLTGGAIGGGLGIAGKVIKGIRTPKLEEVPKSSKDLVSFIQNGKTKGIYGETPETMATAPKPSLKSSFSETAMEEIRKPYRKQAMGQRVTELKLNAERAGVINPGVKISTNAKADEVLTNILEKDLVKRVKGTKFEGITNKGVLKTIKTVAEAEDIGSTKTTAFKTLTKLLNNDKPLSGNTVETLRKWVKGQFKGVAGKTITDAEMTGRQTVLDASHDVIGALLERKVPGAAQTLFDINALSTEATALFNFASNKGRAFIKGVPIPVKQAEMITKATADRLGNQGLLGINSGIIQRIKNAPVPQLPQSLTSKGLSLTPASVLGTAATRAGQDTSAPLSVTETTTGATAPTGITGTGTNLSAQEGQQKILALLAGGMKPSDVKIIADLLGFSPKTTEPKVMSNNQINAQAGLKDISTIRNIIKKNGTASLLVPYILKSSESKQLSNAIDSVSDIIARNRTGAAINEQELQLYLSFLPTVTDDPDTVEFKLSRLENIFNGVLSNVGTSTSTDQLTNQIQTILGQ